MTQCCQQLSFGFLQGKHCTGQFDGGGTASDGGLMNGPPIWHDSPDT